MLSWTVLTASVQASPASCNTHDATQPVPQGYGASYNVHTSRKELLVSPVCDGSIAALTVGNNVNTTYVYNRGYHYDGSAWRQISLQCSGALVSGAWCEGEATGSIPVSSAWHVAYTCHWNGSQWKCGCRDAACTQSFWQLQGVDPPPQVPPSQACSAPQRSLPSYDYSGAGYRNSNAAIPNKSGSPGLTYGPGRHVITKRMNLGSGQVLRGAGKERTTLYFPDGLKAMGVPCFNGNTTDCWDWWHGVILASGSEIGISDLTIEFPDHYWEHYGGPSKNSGFNGLELVGCNDCWVKNVAIRNSDSGVFVRDRSNRVTLENVDVYARSGGGHIHFAFSGTSTKDVLIINFKAMGSTSHGLTGNYGPVNTVFANGTVDGIRLEPDHNGPATTKMLYSNIQGKISSQKLHTRGGATSDALLWNVGQVDRCPLDVFTAQLRKRLGL